MMIIPTWTLVGSVVAVVSLLGTALFTLIRGQARLRTDAAQHRGQLREDLRGELGQMRQEMRQEHRDIRSEQRELIEQVNTRIDALGNRVDHLDQRLTGQVEVLARRFGEHVQRHAG